MSASTKRITITGRVQGVGFRPFVYQLACKLGIFGIVQNNMNGVTIVAQGSSEQLRAFEESLLSQVPAAAKIFTLTSELVEAAQRYRGFSIEASQNEGASTLTIPVDLAVCDDCVQELNDPSNRRYQYPFISCTQCGPRYTIMEALPYDRPNTVMKDFTICEQCASEYSDPTERRHHAQPIACEACGPHIELYDSNGRLIAEKHEGIEQAKQALERGAIIAIKGIGGFHLVCDAGNVTAVSALRQRKQRPRKPLAVMVRSLAEAEAICHVTAADRSLLTSSEAPIVIMPIRKQKVAAEAAPGYNSLGLMLPYTPLHHLLFANAAYDTLIMTSANRSGMPMIYKAGDVYTQLADSCDYVLTDNRPILHSIDDSVMYTEGGRPYFIRRARGFAPEPLSILNNADGIVALGGEQKSVFAAGHNGRAVLSKHIGELSSVEMLTYYEQEFAHAKQIFGICEQHYVIDKHPNYTMTQFAHRLSAEPAVAQHHHAHHTSCMADNGLDEPCLGILLDGTGYGDDGHLWGFEIFHGDASSYERLAHLAYTPLPGGEKAIQEPWRNAAAMLISTIDQEMQLVRQCFPDKQYELTFIKQMIERKINSPLAGTCGRLFDAVSAILGICECSTYEGEAAILLSERLRGCEEHRFEPFSYRLRERDGLIEIDFSEMLRELTIESLRTSERVELIGSFHETVAQAVTAALMKAVQMNKIKTNKVLCSGGSFHNLYLSRRIEQLLTYHHYDVFKHRQVPCNDGGLALGQLMIGAKQRVFIEE